MLKDFMEANYRTFKMSFGKHRGEVLSGVGIDYAIWWMNKREKDETTGEYDIDIEHKMAAEKKHQFNRTYLFFVYHMYQVTGTKVDGTGCYTKMVQKFWEAIDSNADLKERRGRGTTI